MENPLAFNKIKEENIDVEVNQKEVSFEFLAIKEECLSTDENNEDDEILMDIDGNGDIDELQEFTYVKAEKAVEDDLTEPGGHEPDPSALFSVVEIKVETESTEEKHTSTADVCFSNSQENVCEYDTSSVTLHNGVQPYKCIECNYSTELMDDLKLHKKMHSVETPYKCTVCDYSTSRSFNFKVHMRKHTGEKPYKCNECDYATSSSNNLKRHLMVHTREIFKCSFEMFKCTVCDYDTSSWSNIKKHMTLHSVVEPYKSIECNYSTALMDDLKLHKREHFLETRS